MAKRAKPLTTRQVQALSQAGIYADGNNLYLRIGPTGAKSWIFRYAFDHRRRDMGVGPVSVVTLAEAREKAIDLRRLLLAGVDPIASRRAERVERLVEAAKAMTFREAAAAYIAAHRASWRNARHAEEWPRSLERFAFPTFGDISVGAIDTSLVMQALEPVWNQAPETASRVRGRIESVLDWAAARGYRSSENPARWRGHLANLLPNRRRIAPVQHLPALPYAEIAAFMTQLAADESTAAKALTFAILTATRTGEVLGARWDEINLDDQLWTIPGDRMKAGREHRVPLSGPAVALLNKIAETRYSEWVFSGHQVGQPLGKGALAVAMKRAAGDRVSVTVHGFRSCFRDWCAELTRFPAEVAEMALGHQVTSAVEAAYRRGDMFERRRKLADAWGRYCSTQSVVVPLREAAKIRGV